MGLCVFKFDGKCGIKRGRYGEFLLEMEYDNIYKISKFYILVKEGKYGLCKGLYYKEDKRFDLELIAPCEYNSVELVDGDTLLLKDSENEIIVRECLNALECH